jgi:AraC-like DNA-binding protein
LGYLNQNKSIFQTIFILYQKQYFSTISEGIHSTVIAGKQLILKIINFIDIRFFFYSFTIEKSYKMNPIYQEYYVNGSIAHFIKKLWILNNQEDQPSILNKGVPPNGCFTIAIVQGEGLNIRHKNQSKKLSEGIYFCGQITETMYIDIYSGTKATMIQLFPWTPVHFGISDAYLFTDHICPADEIARLKTLDLNMMIGLSNRLICKYIATAFVPFFKTDSNTALIIESTQIIIASKGNITVSSLAQSMNCSVRQLQKLFKKFIGISPKFLIRIINVREALDDMVYPNFFSLTMAQLALSNGYYDQPHFNRTFASFIKTTPKNFIKEDYLLTIKK